MIDQVTTGVLLDDRIAVRMRGFVLGALVSNFLALLAEQVAGSFEVAFSLYEGFLAIHHAGTGHGAELIYVSGGNSGHLVGVRSQ